MNGQGPGILTTRVRTFVGGVRDCDVVDGVLMPVGRLQVRVCGHLRLHDLRSYGLRHGLFVDALFLHGMIEERAQQDRNEP